MFDFRIAVMHNPAGLDLLDRTQRLLACCTVPQRVTWHLIEPDRDAGKHFRHLADSLVEGFADAAVWPAACLPVPLEAGIEIGAVAADRPRSVVCVSRRRATLQTLSPSARVAACDEVTRAQILHRRPDLEVERACDSQGALDGVWLTLWDAAFVPPETAQLVSTFDLQAASVPPDDLMPPAGQGSLVLLTRAAGDAPAAAGIFSAIDDPQARVYLLAERAFVLHSLDIPSSACAARAEIVGDRLKLSGLVVGWDGAWLVTDSAIAPARYVEAIAWDVADACREMARNQRKALVLVQDADLQHQPV